jgi:hypothetical protein
MFGNTIIGSTKPNPAARQRTMCPSAATSYSLKEQASVFLETDVKRSYLVERHIHARVVQLDSRNKLSAQWLHCERYNSYVHLSNIEAARS